MNRIYCLTVVLAFGLLHSGAADSKPASSGTQAAAPKRSFSAATTPQAFVSNKIVNMFRPKTGKELMDERSRAAATASKIPQVPAAAKPAATAPKSMPSVKPGYVPPPPAKPAPQVNQVRQEVQKILELNQQIKNLQGDRVMQLQRIQEQARIHQRILDQLESGKRAQQAVNTDKDALLAQEKMRIIQEETRRNQNLLMTEESQTRSAAVGTQARKLPPVEPVLPQGTDQKT